MAPSPLIKMNLYLVAKEIVYLPNKHEIYDTFTTLLDEIVHIMSTVPRLFEKFALPSGGLKRFMEVIQTEPDCNKLQALIDAGKDGAYSILRLNIFIALKNLCLLNNKLKLLL